jgi:hypothetical protein
MRLARSSREGVIEGFAGWKVEGRIGGEVVLEVAAAEADELIAYAVGFCAWTPGVAVEGFSACGDA